MYGIYIYYIYGIHIWLKQLKHGPKQHLSSFSVSSQVSLWRPARNGRGPRWALGNSWGNPRGKCIYKYLCTRWCPPSKYK